MDFTWFAPVAVLLIGAAVAVVLLRQLLVALAELNTSERRFRRVEHALIPVRVETRRVRASIERIDRR